ncbi:DUF4189 domain-containing protein [Microvirga makkahensis]|uniref:DUF4189 domain-containing protein n=1 Tax=Microvirga makkahensis TaxID=1128670 RepID=A0A7X3SRE0_9HYPH|nr:DUF4189 domain-containing protein [Microvirga makkahensis]MXQ14477.1 DUF4189 domain-containing protein [Microvirga makkahensis]
MRMRCVFAVIGIVLASGQMGLAADLTSRSPSHIPQRQVEAKGIWAAIAYSAGDEKHGFFWGAADRQEAERTALKHCERAGGQGCRVVVVFRNHRHWDDDDGTGFPYNHCGALAVSKKSSAGASRWAAMSAMTRKDAEDLALNACVSGSTQCEIREWVCT